jgi:hypothetical protein
MYSINLSNFSCIIAISNDGIDEFGEIFFCVISAPRLSSNRTICYLSLAWPLDEEFARWALGAKKRDPVYDEFDEVGNELFHKKRDTFPTSDELKFVVFTSTMMRSEALRSAPECRLQRARGDYSRCRRRR